MFIDDPSSKSYYVCNLLQFFKDSPMIDVCSPWCGGVVDQRVVYQLKINGSDWGLLTFATQLLHAGCHGALRLSATDGRGESRALADPIDYYMVPHEPWTSINGVPTDLWLMTVFWGALTVVIYDGNKNMHIPSFIVDFPCYKLPIFVGINPAGHVWLPQGTCFSFK